ncbi:hypothetical protein Bca4012_007420 [Brassica carinata]
MEMVKCLVHGVIGGAGLDVFEKEPGVSEELFGLDNDVMSPHAAMVARFKIGAKANFDLAKWGLVAHVPSFREYMEVGEEEIVACLTLEGIFMSMGKTATKEAYEWRKSRPKLVKALCIKGRVRNDITGYEQYGFPLKEAIRELNKIVADADKTLNEEFLKTVAVGRGVLKAAMHYKKSIK